jgi:hypothetical protein
VRAKSEGVLRCSAGYQVLSRQALAQDQALLLACKKVATCLSLVCINKPAIRLVSAVFSSDVSIGMHANRPNSLQATTATTDTRLYMPPTHRSHIGYLYTNTMHPCRTLYIRTTRPTCSRCIHSTVSLTCMSKPYANVPSRYHKYPSYRSSGTCRQQTYYPQAICTTRPTCSRCIHFTAALQLLQCAVCWLNLSMTTARGLGGPSCCCTSEPGQHQLLLKIPQIPK